MKNILVVFHCFKGGKEVFGHNSFIVEKYPITGQEVRRISEELKKIYELDKTAVILNIIPLGDDND